MAKKKRGNDAIPSWSGFNYQGKAMLLYVLIKLNEILPMGRIQEYSIELEKREDFVIVCNGRSESFHQVKATLSKSKWSSHSVALGKLLAHKNISGNTTAKCEYIVAKEVTDWSDSTNPYRSQVTLFKYSGNTVGVCDVRDYIIKEIIKYNTQVDHPTGHEEVIYGELCLYIDEKVAKMHRQGARNREYKVSFQEFTDTIEEAIRKQRAREEYYLKEQVYDRTILAFKTSLENLCSTKCSKLLSDCDINCAAKVAYDSILRLPDLKKYCRIINPSTLKGWENPLQLIENLPKDKIEDAIFDLFYASETPEKVEVDDSSIYLSTKHCKAANRCVVPTILTLTRHNNGERSLEVAFQNIKNNTDILDILEGNGITVLAGNWNGIISQASINKSWAYLSDDNINDFYKGIEIISVNDLKSLFRGNGGNCD